MERVATKMMDIATKHRQIPQSATFFFILDGFIFKGSSLLGLLLTALNVYELQQMREEHMLHRDDHPITIVEGSMGRSPNNSPVVWILGKHMETGYLTHVKTVFERLGFHVTNGEDDWDAKSHPETMWVQKNNNHRGVRIKQLDELDFESEGSFVQEFVAKPLLIDKRFLL
ncbi:TTL15-like protein [Mya arenaria]|uniref:TTL15-like protein n=1 Tax=Mya arenaria TaxID=6604 RepID=A0ABY7FHZ5_MYAAR|nr:TTL15-like protein [Mya arenaria]